MNENHLFRNEFTIYFSLLFLCLQVNHGSIADQAGLQPGDAVIAVNNIEAFNLRHKDAQDLIVRSGNTFDLTIQRGGSTWKVSNIQFISLNSFQ